MSIPEITVEELAARLSDAPGAALVDVRQPDEYVEAHVPGARLIPLNDVPDRLADFPAGGEVLVICRSGSRSLAACDFLVANGVAAVNVAGGTLAWIESGREVVTGDL